MQKMKDSELAKQSITFSVSIAECYKQLVYDNSYLFTLTSYLL